MAYATGDTRIIIRGSTGGSEEWSNTWTVFLGTGTVQQALDSFHDFYSTLFGISNDLYSETTTAAQARVIDLESNVEVPGTWLFVDGGFVDESLPTECALRVSLTDATGTRGGPFLPAPVVGTCSDTGLFDTGFQTTVIDALTALWQSLFDDDIVLSLDHTTDEVTEVVTSIRVGQVFDVMRSRRRDLVENYATATPPS